MNSKQLHKHSLPIAILVGVGIAASAVTFASVHKAASPQLVSQALVTHALTVKPTRNGLATISVNKNLTDTAVSDIAKPAATAPKLADTAAAAKHAQISFMVESAIVSLSTSKSHTTKQ